MVDSGSKPPENRIHLFDPVGLITNNYANGVKSSNTVSLKPKRPAKSYGNFEEVNVNDEELVKCDSFKSDANDFSDRLTSFNSFSMETTYEKTHDHDREGLELRFGVDVVKDLDEESDASTPRLWKKTNSSSNSNHAIVSPTSSSRARAIANGRRELMEMVKDLPESLYELSLKDIVERKAELEGCHNNNKVVLQEISKTDEEEEEKKTIGKKVKKSDSKKMVRNRSKSVDNGRFLLRTSVFPYFSGGKKNNNKGLGKSNSFTVAEMAKVKSNSSIKVGEKDWWRRKSCVSSESDVSNGLSSKSASTGSSSSSTSTVISIARRSNRFLPTCCIFAGKTITAKSKQHPHTNLNAEIPAVTYYDRGTRDIRGTMNVIM